jgi:hypothetical protein
MKLHTPSVKAEQPRKAATRGKALAARSMPVELTHLRCAEAAERHGRFRKVLERTGRRFLPV